MHIYVRRAFSFYERRLNADSIAYIMRHCPPQLEPRERSVGMTSDLRFISPMRIPVVAIKMTNKIITPRDTPTANLPKIMKIKSKNSIRFLACIYRIAPLSQRSWRRPFERNVNQVSHQEPSRVSHLAHSSPFPRLRHLVSGCIHVANDFLNIRLKLIRVGSNS